MRKLFFVTSLLLSSLLHGQSLVAAGGSVDDRFSYSIGEVYIQTTLDSSRIITAGFHQPNLWGVVLIEHPMIKARIFPNPTSSIVTLEVIGNIGGKSFILTSPEGKVLVSLPILSERSDITLDAYAAGAYNLSIVEADKIISNYRIIKVK